MKLAIVIPAYNEQESLGRVLSSLPKKLDGIDEIKTIVVDDGSRDRTSEVARWNKAIIVKHIVNLGVGAATKTGLEAAKKLNADIAVTVDADGQHDTADIVRLIQPIIDKGYDVAIGSRIYNAQQMPMLKVFGNLFMNFLTFLVFWQWMKDSQSGMKAFSKNALGKINLHSTGYEICSEIIGEIKRNKLKFQEIPIKTIYSDYSKSRGQDYLNGINIFTRIFFIRINAIK